jgi:hypothetical protein
MSLKKPRGGAAEWTTPEQKLWLENQKPAHTVARTQGDKKFSEFWAEIFEAWFVLWPLEPPTEAEIGAGIDAAAKLKTLKTVSLHVHVV